MHATYEPRIITKQSILTASPSELEMLLQHVVLVKDPVVPEKFKPTCVFLFLFNAFNFSTQTARYRRTHVRAGAPPDDDLVMLGTDGKATTAPMSSTK